MEELKLLPNEEEEAQARETMKEMQKAANARLSAALKNVPNDMLNDQWKRGGLCSMCRRKDYCKTQCRANKMYASARIREYLRRRTQIPQMEAAMGAEQK